MSTPKFVGTIATEKEIWFNSTRDKLILREALLAMVAFGVIQVSEHSVHHFDVRLREQIGIVPNDNPIGLNISNEIVSIHLGRSGHASELWLTCLTADTHDLKN